jgi:hypothetical protein
VVPDSIHDFFVAGGSAAGALIGLLFVALSVSSERVSRATPEVQQLHRIRASAALTAFTNALAVSLFALIPGHKIGPTTVAMGAVGLAFIAASLLSLIRLRPVQWRTGLEAVFLVGLAVVFVVQLLEGIDVLAHPGNFGDVQTIAVLVVVCFLVGVSRSWQLIGGPSIRITREVTALIRGHDHGPGNPGNPGNPGALENLGALENPGARENPSNLGAAGSPSAPGSPGSPSAPGSPGSPGGLGDGEPSP